ALIRPASTSGTRRSAQAPQAWSRHASATVGPGLAALGPTYNPEMEYRRFHTPGALVFLTLVTHQRQGLLLEPSVRRALRAASTHVAARHPFEIVAFVVLPDHCHLLWQLPDDDGDFSRRARLIKHHMARQPG